MSASIAAEPTFQNGTSKLSAIIEPAKPAAFHNGTRKLSGNARRADAIELRRLAAGMSVLDLCRAAGIGRTTYHRNIVAGQARPAVLLALEAVLSVHRSLPHAEAASLVRSTYGGFLAAFCHARGLDPAAAHAQDPRAGATGSPLWRALAHARQAAIYLTNTALSLPQRRLADALGLTPAAICLALRSVEQRRDDPELDSLLDRLAGEIMGVMP